MELVTALNRYQGGTLIDQLGYTYTGNQLTTINDASGNTLGLKAGISTFTYDVNGNLATDPTKAAAPITIGYNMLNLPQTITGEKA